MRTPLDAALPYLTGRKLAEAIEDLASGDPAASSSRTRTQSPPSAQRRLPAVTGSRASALPSSDGGAAHLDGVVAAPALTAPAAREPIGWLGQLVAHGGKCLNYEIHYMKHHRQILPIMRAVWDSTAAGGRADYRRHTLMTRRFCEWQCPVFDWQTPDFFGERWGLVDSQLVTTINRLSEGDGVWSKQAPGLTSGYPSAKTANNDFDLEGNPIMYAAGSGVGDIVGTHPAERVIAWAARILSHDNQMEGRILAGPAMSSLAAHVGGSIQAPAWWSHPSRIGLWRNRMVRWYWTAQWLVWACEMLRLHRKGGKGVASPAWWTSHACAWGIAVPTLATQLARHTYVTRGKAKGDKAGSQLEEDMTAVQWERIARLVIQHTPVPGSPLTLGTQIIPASSTGKRALCDIPGLAGSVAPPISLYGGAWLPTAFSHWAEDVDKGNTGFSNFWSDKFATFLKSIVQIAGSLTGGSQVMMAMSTLDTIYACATSLLQNIAAICGGKTPDVGDLVGVVGRLTSSVCELTGSKISIVPDSLWQELQVVGGPLTKFGGAIEDFVMNDARLIQSRFGDLRHIYRWDYIGAAYGALGLDVNAAKSQLG